MHRSLPRPIRRLRRRWQVFYVVNNHSTSTQAATGCFANSCAGMLSDFVTFLLFANDIRCLTLENGMWIPDRCIIPMSWFENDLKKTPCHIVCSNINSMFSNQISWESILNIYRYMLKPNYSTTHRSHFYFFFKTTFFLILNLNIQATIGFCSTGYRPVELLVLYMFAGQWSIQDWQISRSNAVSIKYV